MKEQEKTIRDIELKSGEIYVLTHIICKGDRPDEIWTREFIGFNYSIKEAEAIAHERLASRACKVTEPYLAPCREIVFSEPTIGGMIESVEISKVSRV